MKIVTSFPLQNQFCFICCYSCECSFDRGEKIGGNSALWQCMKFHLLGNTCCPNVDYSYCSILKVSILPFLTSLLILLPLFLSEERIVLQNAVG